jgi:hypothetical protein
MHRSVWLVPALAGAMFAVATPASAAISTVSCIGTSMHISTPGAANSFGSYQLFGTGPNLIPAPVGGNQNQGFPYAQDGTVTVSGPNNPNVWTGVTVQQADGVGYTLRDTIGDVTCPTGLAVTVSSFSARRTGRVVLVRWRTGTEANELGFNVYRQQGTRRVRVNRRLLPALGAVAGSSYSYRDRHAPRHRALRYWLQDVAVDGTRTWHGPVRVSGA